MTAAEARASLESTYADDDRGVAYAQALATIAIAESLETIARALEGIEASK